jgi:hypothetical protein
MCQLGCSCGCSSGRLRAVVLWGCSVLWLLPVLLRRTLLLHLRVLVVCRVVLLVLRRVVVACRRPLLLVVGRSAGALLLLRVLLRVVLRLVGLLLVLLLVAVLLQLAASTSRPVLLLRATVTVGLLVASTSLVVVRGAAMPIALLHTTVKGQRANVGMHGERGTHWTQVNR